MNAVLIRDFQNKIHTQQWTRVRLQSYIAKNSLQTHTPCAAQTEAKEKKKYTRGKKYQSRFTLLCTGGVSLLIILCVCVCVGYLSIPLSCLEHEQQCVWCAVRHDMGHAASDTHFNCVAQYLFFGSLILKVNL